MASYCSDSLVIVFCVYISISISLNISISIGLYIEWIFIFIVLQGGVIAVIAVALLIVFCVIMYAIYHKFVLSKRKDIER